MKDKHPEELLLYKSEALGIPSQQNRISAG